MTRLCIRLYACLLHLYPQRFYNTFAAEMLDVFTTIVTENRADGSRHLIAIILWELLCFPFNVLREHYHEWNSKAAQPLVWWSFITTLVTCAACFLLGVTDFFTFEIGIVTRNGHVSDWMTWIGGRPIPLVFISALLWLAILLPVGLSTTVMSATLVRNWQAIKLYQRALALLIMTAAGIALLLTISAPLRF